MPQRGHPSQTNKATESDDSSEVFVLNFIDTCIRHHMPEETIVRYVHRVVTAMQDAVRGYAAGHATELKHCNEVQHTPQDAARRLAVESAHTPHSIPSGLCFSSPRVTQNETHTGECLAEAARSRLVPKLRFVSTRLSCRGRYTEQVEEDEQQEQRGVGHRVKGRKQPSGLLSSSSSIITDAAAAVTDLSRFAARRVPSLCQPAQPVRQTRTSLLRAGASWANDEPKKRSSRRSRSNDLTPGTAAEATAGHQKQPHNGTIRDGAKAHRGAAEGVSSETMLPRSWQRGVGGSGATSAVEQQQQQQQQPHKQQCTYSVDLCQTRDESSLAVRNAAAHPISLWWIKHHAHGRSDDAATHRLFDPAKESRVRDQTRNTDHGESSHDEHEMCENARATMHSFLQRSEQTLKAADDALWRASCCAVFLN